VIFSERIETLNWLQGRMQEDLKLKEEAIQILHGGMSDIEQQAIVEAFGKPETPLRVLLCSDVASEGINLHYLSHRLVHFDLPWSLMVFQQRNGRVDRYGQSETPIITYLINRSDNPKVRGDQRILEILKEKDEQAYKNIGDPATFMKVHDPEAEEALTMEAMAEGTDAAAFDAQYQPDDSNEGDDLLALFLNPEAAGSPQPDGGDSPTVERYSLFPGDFEFARQALEALNRERRQVEFSANPERATITLTPPDDLDYRFRFLPPEIRPEHGSLVLTADKQRFAEEIRRSRQDENAWPKLHYPLAPAPRHPVAGGEAPRPGGPPQRPGAGPARVPRDQRLLPAGEAVFLVSGLIPNRKAHPVIWEWFAIRCRPGQAGTSEPGAGGGAGGARRRDLAAAPGARRQAAQPRPAAGAGTLRGPAPAGDRRRPGTDGPAPGRVQRRNPAGARAAAGRAQGPAGAPGQPAGAGSWPAPARPSTSRPAAGSSAWVASRRCSTTTAPGWRTPSPSSRSPLSRSSPC
jgi:hypothetical protein